MPAQREDIFSALYTRLSTAKIGTAPAFRCTSRVFQDWMETPPPEQPAMFLIKGNERVVEQRYRLPPKWALEAMLFIYCKNNVEPGNIPPSTQLNALLTAVEQVLQWQPADLASSSDRPTTDAQVQGYTWHTTLGGLVDYAAIEGTVEIFEGATIEHAEAIVPITMYGSGW